MMRNNYRYSVALLDCTARTTTSRSCTRRARRCTAAARAFREERAHEAPLNVYGYSKFLFDQHVRRVLPERTAQIAGFRYFNVYGPREQHKGTDGVGRVALLPPVSRRRPRRAVRGLGRLRRRRAAPRFRRRSTTWSSVNLDFLDHPERSRHLQSRHGTRRDVQRRRRGDDQRVPRRRRRGAALARRARRATARSTTSRSRRRSPASTRASPRPISRGCAPPATRRRCNRSTKAFRATSNG